MGTDAASEGGRSNPILEVCDLSVEFTTDGGVVHAVNNVSYSVQPDETLAIVGESGSGKSAHVLAMLGLIPSPPGRVTNGQARFRGRDLICLEEDELRGIRGQDIGFIFQDPMTSLNPVLTIGRQITEVLRQHSDMSARQARSRAEELLQMVGIQRAGERLDQYPHEFSGGMRQRVLIAIALACEPLLLIADEPTTALDVTVQAQIVELIETLKERLHMAVIWITHDLGVVAGIADTVQVMYAGRVVERGPVRAVYNDPRHAYTLGLLRSLPQSHQKGGRLTAIAGSPPSLRDLPPGDPFAPRNPYATARCWQELPPLVQVPAGAPGHLAAAWYDLRTVNRIVS